ncbi:MAG: efflux RND transporter periplasmic adaptor subunit [Elusimicrobiales bacterium]|nr:efflux RND transporter periplasmic adaptor subunit [Elusimicrobiales bacterium]
MKLKIYPAIVLLLAAGAVFAGYRHFRHSGDATAVAAVKYHCPMHPAYISDKPGDCPICGMKLVPLEPPKAERKVKYYRNPMNPDATSPVPMKDSMGMEYVPVYEEAAETAKPQGAVDISSERQQLIGVKSVAAAKRELKQVVRSAGRVAYDPDLYHAIADYQQAVAALNKPANSQWPEFQEQSKTLVQASALRLRQSGIPESRIAELAVSTQLPTNLLINQNNGTIWVYAQIYEYEIGLVKAGQPARVESYASPGKTFYGTVKSVDAILSAETRTLKVRIEVSDREGLLKPEMYADVSIDASLGRVLAVPRDAVMDTGTRKVVFIDKGNGEFEPRTVRIGFTTDDYIQIVSGLSEGEKIVAAANFLLDSESKLKSAFRQTGSE